MTKDNKTNVAIFDLDGTLINSQQKLTRDVVGTFARLETQITPEQVTGNWYDLAESYGFSREQFDRAFGQRKTWEESLKAGEVQIFPDTYVTLNNLKRKNTRLALLSMSNQEYTNQKINHFNLGPYFEDIKIVDVKAPSKEQGALELIADLDPNSIDKAYFIGDKEEDINISKVVKDQYSLSSEGIYVSRDGKSLNGYRNIHSLKELTKII